MCGQNEEHLDERRLNENSEDGSMKIFIATIIDSFWFILRSRILGDCKAAIINRSPWPFMATVSDLWQYNGLSSLVAKERDDNTMHVHNNEMTDKFSTIAQWLRGTNLVKFLSIYNSTLKISNSILAVYAILTSNITSISHSLNLALMLKI